MAQHETDPDRAVIRKPRHDRCSIRCQLRRLSVLPGRSLGLVDLAGRDYLAVARLESKSELAGPVLVDLEPSTAAAGVGIALSARGDDLRGRATVPGSAELRAMMRRRGGQPVPTVSMITPLFAPAASYLRDTIASVAAQRLPSGWHVEWLVQEDGPAPALAEQFRQVPFARYEANGAQLGVAATRNLALSRATGDLIQVLDHDDVLLPGAFAALIPRFGMRSIHWAVGQADDLMPDGRRVSWDSALPFGLVPRGAVNTLAIEREGNWPIHCAGLMLRTDSVRALGGWAATPSDDDVVMFSALAELTEGYNEPTVTWLYRQHHGQAHRSPAWRQHSEQGRRVALQRIMAIRHAGLTLSHTAPVTVGNRSTSAAIRVGPPEKES